MDERNSPYINLNGKLLRVGADGINANYSKTSIYIRDGVITSSSSNLILKSGIPHEANLNLDAVISDNGLNKVGVFVNSIARPGTTGVVSFDGGHSNTFTGDVFIEGKGATLFMNKHSGATSVRGNIYVRNGGRAAVAQSDQISDTSTVTLSGQGSMLSFAGTMMPASEKIHKLVAESGKSILSFQHHLDPRDQAKRLFYFDDLIITPGSLLTVLSWKAARDYFLVRKNSAHLQEALKRLMIDGWGHNQIYLKNYDKDYWSIEAAPEPSTCGALFGAVGLGLATWRRRPRRPRLGTG